MWLKACARCGGDLFMEEDMREREFVCLQCGFRKAAGPVVVYHWGESASRAGNGTASKRIAA